MTPFDEIALRTIAESLAALHIGPIDEQMRERMADLACDLAEMLDVAMSNGATLDQIAAVMELPAKDLAPFAPESS